MDALKLNPSELLGEQVLAIEKERADQRAPLMRWLAAAEVAIPAMYRIAQTGNVQAKEACKLIHAILRPLPRDTSPVTGKTIPPAGQ